MKISIKILLLFILFLLNLFFINHVKVVPVNIESFFPHESREAEDEIQRIVFAPSEYKKRLNIFLNEGLLNDLIEIPGKPDVLIVTLPEKIEPVLAEYLQNNNILGPPVIGELLSEVFIENIQKYVYIVIPFLIPFFIYLTSWKYLLNVMIEMFLICTLFLSFIAMTMKQMNIAYLLSFVFSMIYAFTIINYFYYGGLKRSNLIKGIVISLITTLLSGLFLWYSSFAIISDYGISLSIWLMILMGYFALRLLVTTVQNKQLIWLNRFVDHRWPSMYGVYAILIFILFGIFNFPVNINLNPIANNKDQHMIQSFEESYLLSQPILLSIESRQCPFKEEQCLKKLDKLLAHISEAIPVRSERIFDLATVYRDFANENVDDLTQPKLAQFLLALDMMSGSHYFLNPNGDTAYAMFNVSMTTSTGNLREIIDAVERTNEKFPEMQCKLHNHLQKITSYEDVFIEEAGMGLLVMFGSLLVLFYFFLGKIFVMLSFIPAIITIFFFFTVHAIFKIDVTLMSLVSLILFVGLMSDKIIHIFIHYKNSSALCRGKVYKPIILSDTLMIIALWGMAFTGTLLQQFGLELGFLLLVHLYLLIYLLPKLHKKYM